MNDSTFPPSNLNSFLALCVGEWMSLRSCFELTGGDDDWHTSERGDVTVRFCDALEGAIGRLEVVPPKGVATNLLFEIDGGLKLTSVEGLNQTGQWLFWPDGSVELTLAQAGGAVVQERIWFTRPNLRLRSTTAVDSEGVPLQGSFCTDIRRVSKPAS
ncbi:MAG: phycobiliprotein lyase [Cyanobium sp. NAT70]|nr:phycobiliprotein lyase [Cyanobium sp. NAT70]|tara:strand:- start:4316 stop:4789 length:474 start_codon:yes stop_codon:yes gene_type:complete